MIDRATALLLLISVCFARDAAAHEFWVQPDEFWLTPPAALSVTLQVGDALAAAVTDSAAANHSIRSDRSDRAIRSTCAAARGGSQVGRVSRGARNGQCRAQPAVGRALQRVPRVRRIDAGAGVPHAYASDARGRIRALQPRGEVDRAGRTSHRLAQRHVTQALGRSWKSCRRSARTLTLNRCACRCVFCTRGDRWPARWSS